ncbi:hypothetical protein SARC_08225 [Sphaeroforma arctica JP610]|uniref:Uncharacterized protein n=1 Tax=Sphaeroforma arctica JP610 TaxID=667725 RepID=A0A0L0FRR2_9EUKA|nr:hypothetical protein SARC_08225 [Sphaeroforma arctica JP610]KNC79379.1 hypothetical protein SARC_08225 [Sphaeroforma arctica JP610]|eukprot:XP_014153281.1 hypothetical protein SARC_08225 [Sphaeroforma arctica JP610]
MEVINWPKAITFLSEAQAFAREFWPELPVYTSLESANGHMDAINNVIKDLSISYDEIFGSTAKTIPHRTMARSDLYLANKNRKDIQTGIDNCKRHNVQLGDEHKVLLAKHESLQIDHKQLTDRLTEAQSHLSSNPRSLPIITLLFNSSLILLVLNYNRPWTESPNLKAPVGLQLDSMASTNPLTPLTQPAWAHDNPSLRFP